MYNKTYTKSFILSFLLGFFVFALSYFLYLTENKLYVSFINVGQGDSALITLPDKTNILYDTGKENFGINNIEKELDKSFLVRESLDYIILSHSDIDHSGEINYFTNNNNLYNLKQIYLNNIYYYKNEKFDFVKNYMDKVIEVYNGYSLYFDFYKNKDNTKLSFINPIKDNVYLDENSGSVGAILNLYKINFIFMADIDENTEKSLVNNGIFNNLNKKNCKDCINILKVGHHGSKTSSSEEFLKEINPTFCVISVGKNNYGHPNEDAVKRLGKYCKKIYRTDIDGNIGFEVSDDLNLKVRLD